MSIWAQVRMISIPHRSLKADVRNGCSYLLKKGLKAIPAANRQELVPCIEISKLHMRPKICNLRYHLDTPASYQKERSTLNFSLVKNALQLPFRGQNKLICSNDYHDSEDGSRESSNQLKWNRTTAMATLSVLGLFGGMTASDVDEETSKLNDETKMSKMSPVELLIAKGVLSMCNQEYAKANELFHQALHIAQDEANEEQETLVLNLLAANYFEKGEFEKAESLFIDLIKRMINNDVNPTDPAILELSLKLASIYSRNRETHDKALKGFKFVINSLLNNLHDLFGNLDELEVHSLSESRRNELALLGWSYDWFAKHLISVNDYNGAADMLQQALEISAKVLGPLHDQTLILLNDVGTTLAMNNAAERGKAFLKKAVEGAIQSRSDELASFYVNLGLVNLKLKSLSEAKRYCEYSIELALKNSEHPNSKEVLKLSKNCLNEVERLIETGDVNENDK